MVLAREKISMGIQAPTEYLKIRNNSDVPQSVVHNGIQFILKPHAEEVMDANVARKFLVNRHPVVTEVQDIQEGTFKMQHQGPAWVANVRGSRKFPEKVKVQHAGEKRRMVLIEVDNPKRVREPVTQEYDEGQQEVLDQNNKPFFRNLPKIELSIAPRSRKQYPKDIVQWLLRRDNNQMPEMKGCLIESRAPSNFEPDMRWALNDMRNYLRYLDPEAKLGLDEEALKLKLSKSRKNDPTEAARELREAKADLLDKLFDYLADPRYSLPTKEEFEEFVTGKPASVVEEEEIARLLGHVEAETAEGADFPGA